MNQTFAVWIVIVLSLAGANLPFLAQRPFLVLPWTQPGEAVSAAWLNWLGSLVFFALLCGVGYLALTLIGQAFFVASDFASAARSEEHTSELQSLMRISYAVFCLKKKKN